MPKAYFSRELFRFLDDLSAHNERPWFQENKGRYERHVKDAALAFIEDVDEPLREISPHLVADPSPVGGSLFRIYRDTRFSKDKSPYKTHVGIRFQHERGKDVHTPGFYLHIGRDGAWIGCGIWRPDGDALFKIRTAIVEDPDAWKRAVGTEPFRSAFELHGETLKRGPRGFDLDHPLIEDLKRKDFVGTAPIAKKALLAPDFLDTFIARCREGSPLNRFICGALGLAY
ncbi:MAG: DUF2461 domain-containing protein [Gemmatimonadota bacterium]|nr:DUF2461 domain-containing protein [Gemmatimonadota bacterium]